MRRRKLPWVCFYSGFRKWMWYWDDCTRNKISGFKELSSRFTFPNVDPFHRIHVGLVNKEIQVDRSIDWVPDMFEASRDITFQKLCFFLKIEKIRFNSPQILQIRHNIVRNWTMMIYVSSELGPISPRAEECSAPYLLCGACCNSTGQNKKYTHW